MQMHQPSGAARPFIPHSVDFLPLKAKLLHKLLPTVPLSTCQMVVAQALGWKDPFVLRAAIMSGQQASLPDEEVGQSEAVRRRALQVGTLRQLCASSNDCEHLVEVLSLTRLSSAATRMMTDVGPWGTFDAVPREVAAGIYAGMCEGEQCYRLTVRREEQMPARYRLEENGWYGGADAWRVVLSFPELFDSTKIAQAETGLADSGQETLSLFSGLFVPNVESRLAVATRQPSALFALSAFPDWICCGTAEMSKVLSIKGEGYCVVSAVKGADLVSLLENNIKTWSAKRTTPVFWFAMEMVEFAKAYEPIYPETQGCISGLLGWAHPPLDGIPYKSELFGGMELDCTTCVSWVPMRKLAVFQHGTPVVIP